MAKYPQWTEGLESASFKIKIAAGQVEAVAGRVEALVSKLGTLGDELVADGLLSGALKAEVVDGRLVIQPGPPLLFDCHGRRIPPRGLAARVHDPNHEFYFSQPELNYSNRLEQLARHFPPGTFFPSASEFEVESLALLEQIAANEQLASLLKGVHLPVCLPWLAVPDYGQVLEEVFIASVGRAYNERFPRRSFTNDQQGELNGQVTIIPGTRHERLLERMAEALAVGIYFPNPLQGFSVHTQREQMATLPESLLLAGALDTAMAWAMYPDVLAQDYRSPGCICAAVQYQSSTRSLCFNAGPGEASFSYKDALDYACDRSSGGLLFLG